MINTIQYTAYWVYYRGDEDAMVKDMCSEERMKKLGATKKLTNVGIIVNGLVNKHEVTRKSETKDETVSLRLE
jgi:hypothetical protein